MADRPAARDEDRLPWLEPFSEGERARRRKPVSRTALVGLLVVFFGIGLAVAFSLGYRVARPADETSAPRPTRAVQPERTASVQVPLAPPAAPPKIDPVVPPAAPPKIEPVAPPTAVVEPMIEQPAPQPAVVEPPVAGPKPVVKAEPTIKKAPTVRHKAKAPRRYARKKPILRPFLNVKRPPARPPVRYVPPPPAGPRGRVIQLGAFSTQRQAVSAWRTIVFRYPYLRGKPNAVFPTPPVGGHRYYRLQLATESQAQSVVICQHLQSRGQSCIVLY